MSQFGRSSASAEGQSYEKVQDALDREVLLHDSSPQKVKTHSKINRTLLIYIIVFVLYAVVTIIAVSVSIASKTSCLCDSLIHSPARKAISYERITFVNDLDTQSVFIGEPRQELHDAWHSLLKFSNIRVQQDDLSRINRTSVPLNDSQGGFYATIDVFHELHCLNVIREQVYREYYPTRHSKRDQLEHANHCIDLLRQTLMCHGDVALQTFTWIEGYKWPWPNFSVQHECRKWDALQQWASQNYIPDLEGPILTHPVLGVSYEGNNE